MDLNAERLRGEHVNNRYLVRNSTCPACPIACEEVEIKAGPHADLRVKGVEAVSESRLAELDVADGRVVGHSADLTKPGSTIPS